MLPGVLQTRPLSLKHISCQRGEIQCLLSNINVVFELILGESSPIPTCY